MLNSFIPETLFVLKWLLLLRLLLLLPDFWISFHFVARKKCQPNIRQVVNALFGNVIERTNNLHLPTIVNELLCKLSTVEWILSFSISLSLFIPSFGSVSACLWSLVYQRTQHVLFLNEQFFVSFMCFGISVFRLKKDIDFRTMAHNWSFHFATFSTFST